MCLKPVLRACSGCAVGTGVTEPPEPRANTNPAATVSGPPPKPATVDTDKTRPLRTLPPHPPRGARGLPTVIAKHGCNHLRDQVGSDFKTRTSFHAKLHSWGDRGHRRVDASVRTLLCGEKLDGNTKGPRVGLDAACLACARPRVRPSSAKGRTHHCGGKNSQELVTPLASSR